MNTAAILTSAIILVLTLICAVYINKKKRRSKIKPVYAILIGVFLSVFSVMLYVDNRPNVYGTETAPFLALLHTIQVLLAGYDFDSLQTAFDFSTKSFSTPYMYLSFLFVIAPLCTFSFVLSFFESINSYMRFLLSWRKDIYVISALSDKSIALARSIRAKFPKSAIIFTNVSPKTDEGRYNLLDNIQELNAIIFKADIREFNAALHSSNSNTSYFLIAEKESDNLESALSLIDKYRGRKNTEMYVFSTSKEGELLLDSVDKGIMKVRRINESQALAYSVISSKDTLITNDFTVRDGKKIISTLIVGFSGYGTELTKALLWCGQLPGYELEINVIDKNKNAESIFKAACPEIFKLNHNKELGEAVYSLNFYNGIDAATAEFNDIISTLTNTSVVYVSLGNDELNIETAITLRILFERIGLYPKIRAIVYSEIKHDTLKYCGLINYKRESYDIEIIGNISTRYSYDTIVNKELEAKALKHHYAWAYDQGMTEEELKKVIERETKNYNEIEYYRNSSTATAIYDLYRENENISNELASFYEHLRWNAYMRTEGYIFSGSTDAKTRNDRAKMHHNLVRQSLLNTGDVEKDERMVNMS